MAITFPITANTRPRQLKEERVSFGSQLQGKSIMAGKSWGPKLEAAGPMAPRTKPGEQCRPSISKGDLAKLVSKAILNPAELTMFPVRLGVKFCPSTCLGSLLHSGLGLMYRML